MFSLLEQSLLTNRYFKIINKSKNYDNLGIYKSEKQSMFTEEAEH